MYTLYNYLDKIQINVAVSSRRLEFNADICLDLRIQQNQNVLL